MRMREKIKEKFRQKWNSKAERYKIAGLFCLFLTVVILSLAVGSNSRANTVTIGNFDFTEAKDSEGKTYYEITKPEELQNLGSLTTGTSGNTFKLQNDIKIESIWLSKGTFEGTFDGNGHVITITGGMISESTGKDSASTSGILFGKVAEKAKIQNLIVETGEIIYQKDSSTGKDDGTKTSSETGGGQDIMLTGKTYAIGDYINVEANAKDYEIIDKYEDISNTNRKYYVSTKNITNNIEYSGNDAKNDYFGILCGELSGTIQRVVVNGESLAITQNIVSSGSATGISTDTKNVKHIYEKTTENMIADNITITENSVSPEILSNTTSDGANEAVSGTLKLTVSADGQSEVTVGTTVITYAITVENNTGKDLKDITITASEGVTFDNKTATYTLDSLDVNATSSKITATYTIKQADILTTGTNDITATFSATAKAGVQTISTDTASLTTTLTSSTSATATDGFGSSGGDNTLNLSVTVNNLDSVLKDSKITYTITATNKTGKDLKDITITASKGVTFDNNTATYTLASLGIGVTSSSITAIYTIASDDIPKIGTNDITATFSATAATTEESSEDITISEFGVSATLTTKISFAAVSDEKTSSAINENQIKMTVTTKPAKATNNSGAGNYSATISYEISIENNTGSELEVSVSNDKWTVNTSGEWSKEGSTSMNSDSITGEYIIAGVELSNGINKNVTLDVPFIVRMKESTSNILAAEISNVSATVYDFAEIKNVSLTKTDTGLDATLSCPMYAVPNDSIDYTLRLENKKADTDTGIQYTMNVSGVTEALTDANSNTRWNVSSSSSNLNVLKKNEVVKFVTNITAKDSGNTIIVPDLAIPLTKLVPAYQYIEVDDTGDETFGEVKVSYEIFAGNSLYSGVFAGNATSTAEILESVQNCPIDSKTTYTSQNGGSFVRREDDSKNKFNSTVNLFGLLLGSDVAKTIDDIHIQTSADVPFVGTKENTSFTSNRIVGINNVDEPGEWDYWTKFQYYDKNAMDKTSAFALKWLVNELDTTKFESSFDKAKNTVTVAISNVKNSLDYKIVYQARKQLGDDGEQNYFVSKDSFELGNSGYYRLTSFYATDGHYYYLYMPTDISKIDWKYPHLTGNSAPPDFTNVSWSVERQVKFDEENNPIETLDDMVKLSGFTLPSSNSSSKLYYLVSGEKNWVTSVDVKDNTASFEFPSTQTTFKVDITPCVDDKFYPIVEFSGDALYHKELPQPEIMASFYVDANNAYLDAEPFRENSVYENGTKFSIQSKGDYKYSYEYIFSTSSSFPEVVSTDWQSYINAISVPEDTQNSYYFYVKVSFTNYQDKIYQYGPFSIKENTIAVPQFYYDKSVDAAEIEGSNITIGDVFQFKMLNAENDAYEIEYKIDENDWIPYNKGEKLVITKGVGTCKISTRVKMSNGKYGISSTYVYLFAEQSDEVKITPKTLYAGQSGIVAVPSGTKVLLDSYQDDSKILYVFNGENENDKDTKFTIERVTEFPIDVKLKDGLVYDKYTYYQIGERWYRLKTNNANDKILLYDKTNDSSIILLNKESETIISRYVHTIVLTKDMEASKQGSYEYKISKVGAVSTPEAVLTTKHDGEGGSDIAVAEAVQGSYLSFTSLTQGAELYYEIGTGKDAPTKKYDVNKGIQVTGDVNSKFYIRVQAKDSSTDENTKLKDSDIITFEYLVIKQEGIVGPSATPATSSISPAIVIPGSKILLSSNTKDATIYYTTDGSYPDVKQDENGIYTIGDSKNSTKEYKATEGITMPLDGSGYFTIRAISTKKGMAPSSVVEFIYAYPTEVLSPYVNVQEGAVAVGTKVSLKNRTEGATIYYTFAYGTATPEDPTISSSVFDGSREFEITKNITIKAMAMKDGIKSNIVTFKYTAMDILAAPTASLESGSIVSRGSKLTLRAKQNAVIYYTLDGSEPNESGNASIIQGSTIVLDGAAGEQITVKAYATLEGMTPSEVVIFTYQISQSTAGVTADIPNGTEVSNGTKVNLTSDVTDAVIYYTMDGSSPLDKGKGTKGSIVTIAGESGSSVTIKAAAVLNGDAGSVVSFTYKIKEKPSAPTASPSGGVLTIATYVKLSASVEKIYYTTDGTTPTESSTLYEEPILINKTTYLQAIAVSDSGECSDVAQFQYTAASKAEKPTATLESGSILNPGDKVSLWTDTPNTEIYYSTDGTEPTLDNLGQMLEYTEDGITIQRSVTIKAVAYRSDMQLSNVSTYQYVVETIPAVEIRKAEEEKKAAEGLQDSNTSGLERREDYEGTAYESRILRNDEYQTVVSSTWDAIPANATLVVEEKEKEEIVEEKVRQSFGEDYEVLNSYEINLSVGSTFIQPNGEVEIGIPIPEEYQNASVSIVYVDSERKLTKLETRRKDGMAYAKVNHFSHYALVGRAQEKQNNESHNYLVILETAAGFVLCFGFGFWIFQKWKKIKKNS